MDVWVGCQELLEVTNLVQLLFVIAHARFPQQTGDLIFQLHGLVHEQVALPQRAPPFANLGRGPVAFR